MLLLKQLWHFFQTSTQPKPFVPQRGSGTVEVIYLATDIMGGKDVSFSSEDVFGKYMSGGGGGGRVSVSPAPSPDPGNASV